MRCPRCTQIIFADSVQCPNCAFSLSMVEETLGNVDVKIGRTHDAVHCLKDEERARLEKVHTVFDAAFPQLFLVFFISVLPEPMNLRQLGFWLLNHAGIEGVDFSRPNEQGVIISLDIKSMNAAIHTGYFLEPYLQEKEMQWVLKAAKRFWKNEKYGQVFESVAKRLMKVLQKRSREVLENPSLFDENMAPSAYPVSFEPLHPVKTVLIKQEKKKPVKSEDLWVPDRKGRL